MRKTITILTIAMVTFIISPLLGFDNHESKNAIADSSATTMTIMESKLFKNYPNLGKVPMIRGRAVPCTTTIIIQVIEMEIPADNKTKPTEHHI